MRQIVKDYKKIFEMPKTNKKPEGNSLSPRELMFNIFDNTKNIKVLDIGFGAGVLGHVIKNNPVSLHWEIDGVDAWDVNCSNENLFALKIYRNIYHGFAQSLPSEIFKTYDLICLLDVIEHVNYDTARWLLRFLLTNLNENSYLFISTPLWFMPQGTIQEGDLEEHLIGVPATSMFCLNPLAYSINEPLVGGFILDKSSLDFVDLFHPTSDKNFSYMRGLQIIKTLNMGFEPGKIYKLR